LFGGHVGQRADGRPVASHAGESRVLEALGQTELGVSSF
jgi:hypothetical protein